VLIAGGAGELIAWRWSDPRSFPPVHDGSAVASSAPIVNAAPGGQIEPGRRYAYPLSIHCGAEYLGNFNSRQWWSVGPGPRPGDGGPLVAETILGFVRLVGGRIAYTTPSGEAIGTYVPSDREPPGCA
jgi:hypothetical protein